MNAPAPRRSPISTLLRDAEHGHGGRDVVSWRVEGDLHRCSRAELTARARRAANALAACGIVPGDRVATLAWNSHRPLEVAFAAFGSGAIVHALDPQLHPDRIVRIADDARVRIVFFDLSFMPLVEEIAPRLANATTFVALTDRANMPAPATIWDLLCYEDVVDAASDDFDWPEFDDATIGALCGMAGREAEQEGAVSTLLPAIGAGMRSELRPAPQDVVLSAIPMYQADGWDTRLRSLGGGRCARVSRPLAGRPIAARSGKGRGRHDCRRTAPALAGAARPRGTGRRARDPLPRDRGRRLAPLRARRPAGGVMGMA